MRTSLRLAFAAMSVAVLSCVEPADLRNLARAGAVGDGAERRAAAPRPASDTASDSGPWVFCLRIGNVCAFDGIRDVRLVATNGSFVVQRDVSGYPGIPCAGYGFSQKLTGTAERCEYGPLKTQPMRNPMPGMIFGETLLVPKGDTGSGRPLLTSTTFVGNRVEDGLGAFRTTCTLAKFAFDDPIVYPNQPGVSHLHMFFGNTDISASSTTETIATKGGSTCRGGILNRTAYWIPAMYDSVTKEIKLPRFGQFYYKSGSNVDVTLTQDIPTGLRMIAGDKNYSGNAAAHNVFWACGGVNQTSYIPDCVNGVTVLTLSVSFPECWDGKSLDSPDHQSHMAYIIYQNPPLKSYCPKSHPVQLPAIAEQFDFPIHPGDQHDRWRLTSDMYPTSLRGGRSAHADWMLGWDKETMNTIITECLRKGLDCGVGTIGKGKVLESP
jgi:hypothetical protein